MTKMWVGATCDGCDRPELCMIIKPMTTPCSPEVEARFTEQARRLDIALWLVASVRVEVPYLRQLLSRWVQTA